MNANAEAVRFVDSHPDYTNTNYGFPEPFFDKVEEFHVFGDVVSESHRPKWERRNTNLLLGYEVLRLSGIEDILQQFNGDVLGHSGELEYLRRLLIVPVSEETTAQTGKEARYVVFNAVSLGLECAPLTATAPLFLRLGMGIIDANQIGFFFMEEEKGQPNCPSIFEGIESKNRPYAYLQGPNLDSEAKVYPVISNDTIASPYFFEHLRVLTYNAISGAINFHVKNNKVQDFLPRGVQEMPVQRPLIQFPQSRFLLDQISNPSQTLVQAA